MPALTTGPKDYLLCRERYLVALHKYNRFGEKLRALVGASSHAELEEKLLDAATRARFLTEIREYADLGRKLDSASDLLDLATELQKRRVAQNCAEYDSIISTLDE